MGFGNEGLEQQEFQTVLRAAGETETAQGNVPRLASAGRRRPWTSASDRGRNCCSNIVLFVFIYTHYVIEFSIYFVSLLLIFLLFSFFSLINLTLPLLWISEDLLYLETVYNSEGFLYNSGRCKCPGFGWRRLM
jgi:hypothetical protein